MRTVAAAEGTRGAALAEDAAAGRGAAALLEDGGPGEFADHLCLSYRAAAGGGTFWRKVLPVHC